MSTPAAPTAVQLTGIMRDRSYGERRTMHLPESRPAREATGSPAHGVDLLNGGNADHSRSERRFWYTATRVP